MAIKNIIFDLYGVLINHDGLMHDTADILKLCAHHHGLTCYGLSNISNRQRDHYVHTFPILRNLKMIATSEDSGFSKPEAMIFHYLTQVTKIDPHESIFIDDNLDNCAAASRLGFRAIHFKDAYHLGLALDLEIDDLFEDPHKEKCEKGCSCHPK